MLYPNQFQQQYQNQYQPQIQAPMDRLAQLQAQQYNIPTQMSGTYQQPVTLPEQSMQQPNQNLLYVQGEAAAKSWMLGRGQSVLLIDSEAPVFYIKSTDSSGMPYPLRVFDYKERPQSVQQEVPQAPQAAQNNLDDKYATKQEYDELQGKYNDLQGKYMEILNKLDNIPASPTVPKDTKQPTTVNKARSK